MCIKRGRDRQGTFVIVFTACGQTTDQLAGLEAGMDDSSLRHVGLNTLRCIEVMKMHMKRENVPRNVF